MSVTCEGHVHRLSLQGTMASLQNEKGDIEV